MYIFINSSYISIRIKNSVGYSLSSDPARLLILNNDEVDDLATLPPVITDPSILPSKPVIEQAVIAFESLFIKWSLENNGGFDINQITVFGLNYGSSGPLNTFSLGFIYFRLI
jgi:hypothetical protein